MVTGYFAIALIAAFLSVSVTLASTARGLHYSVIINVIPDESSVSSIVTTRNVLTCAMACSIESENGTCTIASYNKNTSQCTLSTSTTRDLIYYEGQDKVTLVPQIDCDMKELPGVVNGLYVENPSKPGYVSIKCDDDYDISLSSGPNRFVCDVTGTWVYNNVTCSPEVDMKFTEGRSFIATFMGNFETSLSDISLYLYVVSSNYDVNSTSQHSYVTVSVPSASFTKTYTVNQSLEIDLSNINVSEAIYVTSDNPVTMFTMNKNQYSTGGMLVYPRVSLGKTYVIASTPYDDLESSLIIISEEEGATVMLNFPDDSVENVNITYGNSYELKRVGLSGTYIESDKDIAVFAGEKCANLPNAGNYSCDHIIEQMPPLEALDFEYVIAPTKPRSHQYTHRCNVKRKYSCIYKW